MLVSVALILWFSDQDVIFRGLPVQVILQWKQNSLNWSTVEGPFTANTVWASVYHVVYDRFSLNCSHGVTNTVFFFFIFSFIYFLTTKTFCIGV